MTNEIASQLEVFLSAHDLSEHTRRAVRADVRKFAAWFSTANNEPLDPKRITVRDVADFRNHLQLVRRQAVATVNRALVTIRRFLNHLVQAGVLASNPAIAVKELRRMPSSPKGLAPAEVRRIMREIELRQDHRTGAILGLMLYSGLRVSDVIGIQTDDLLMNQRSGHVICRRGKGNKQRTVPLSAEARRLLTAYMDVRPSVASPCLFIGERGPLTDDGVRTLCRKYSAICGVPFTPHTLRHTFAHRFLTVNNNDLVALAQILGHENLNTTALYTKRTQEDLQSGVDQLRFE